MVWGASARVQPAADEDKRAERRVNNLADFGLVSGATVALSAAPSTKTSAIGADATRVRSFTANKSWSSLATMMAKHGGAVANTATRYTASSALNTCTGSIATFVQVPNHNIGRGLAFSPTGQLLLHYGQGPDIVLIKTADGSQVDTLRKTKGSIRFAEFSTDGKHLVAASDDFWVFVYDVTASVDRVSKLVTEINMNSQGGEAASFCLLSPNGDLVLTIDDDGQLATWRKEDGTFVQRYDSADAETQHCSVHAAFTENGRTVISCSDYECGVVLFDTGSAEIVHCEMFAELQEGRNKADYVISSDGRWVVVYIKDEQTTRFNVAVYNVNDKTHKTYMLCGGAVLHATFHAKNRNLVLCGRDSLVQLFDIGTMEQRGVLQGHDSDVRCCTISRDGQHAISVDKSAQVLIWDMATSQPRLRLQAPMSPHAAMVYCDVSSDGMRAFTLDDEGHAHLWYLEMQGVFKVMMTDSDLLSCFELAPRECSMVVGYADGMLRMWSFGLKAQQVWWHCQHTSSVECVAFSPSGSVVVSGSRDGMMVISSRSDGQVLGVVQAHDDAVTSFSYSADGGMLLSSARDGVLWVWDTHAPGPAGGRAPSSMTGASGGVAGGGGKGSGALGSQHPRLRPQRQLKPPGRPGDEVAVFRCCLDPKGNKAVAGFLSGLIAVWDAHTGTRDVAMAVSNVGVSALGFAHNGRYLIAGSADGAAAIIEMETFKMLCRLDENASGLTDVYFESVTDLSELRLVTVCSRQAVAWQLTSPSTSGGAPVATPVAVADFIAGKHNAFLQGSHEQRGVFIAHQGLAIYDPQLKAVMYHMEEYEEHPGNSSVFRKGTAVLQGGVGNERLVLYAPPDKTVSVLMNETGCITCLDFSTDGRLLVSGSKRGELIIWDVTHRQPIIQWMAHKRSVVHCVKFSNDGKQVYSCGEDCKVLLWNWSAPDRPESSLVGHGHPVVCVEMSLDKTSMVSGDKSGTVVIWDAVAMVAKQVCHVHDGAVLCCSISPDGSKIISSGADEHICIIDAQSGDEILNLDEVLDGAGLTAKFSFDGTRVQIGGEKGNILIWSVESNCLLYDIEAHAGSVYDCSWSGDSRWLLSVGTDGKARLWDAAAGSEMCQASFENGFGNTDTGGFVKCDLSQDGTIMAGCTAKGHLMQWEVGLELRRAPNGQMLFHWLASMPAARARELYVQLLRDHPLLHNVQDGRGLTLLMHAAANGNPTIVNIIVGSIRPKHCSLGLMTSRLQSQPLTESTQQDGTTGLQRMHTVPTYSSTKTLTSMDREHEQGQKRGKAEQEHDVHAQELNAISIAIQANNSDCVDLILNAVLDEKVTPGSYHPVTSALCGLANQYPNMCEVFLTRLPLRLLGEMEIPSTIASKGTLVRAATSYTSYRELWEDELRLHDVPKGPMVVMEAVMVQLPFANSFGANSLLHELVESKVNVKTFGSDTVRTVIDYKWEEFAKSRIYTNTGVYMLFLIMFTIYAGLVSKDPGPPQLVYQQPTDITTPSLTCPYPDWSNTTAVVGFCQALLNISGNGGGGGNALTDNSTGSGDYGGLVMVPMPIGVSFTGLFADIYGRTLVALSFIIFFYSAWFLNIKITQLTTLGFKQFFTSFWNAMDITAYTIAMVIPPCVLMRKGLNDAQFVYPVVAGEVILLWTKSLFYGLAVDGLGTFIFMIIEIIKGLKFFYGLLLVVYTAFAVALINLCRSPPSGDPQYNVFPSYDSPWLAYLSLWQSTFQNQDARGNLGGMYSGWAILVMCLAAFMTNILMINLIVTLMNTRYSEVKITEDYVFRRNRAELIMEVETTMRAGGVDKYGRPPPYLHVLRTINIQDKIQAYDQFNDNMAMDLVPAPVHKDDIGHNTSTHPVLGANMATTARAPTTRRVSALEPGGLERGNSLVPAFPKINEEGEFQPSVAPAPTRNLPRTMSRQASSVGNLRPSSRHMNRNLSRQSSSAASQLPKSNWGAGGANKAGRNRLADMPAIGEGSGSMRVSDSGSAAGTAGNELLLLEMQRKLGDIHGEMRRLGASQKELQRQVERDQHIGAQSMVSRWSDASNAASAAVAAFSRGPAGSTSAAGGVNMGGDNFASPSDRNRLGAGLLGGGVPGRLSFRTSSPGMLEASRSAAATASSPTANSGAAGASAGTSGIAPSSATSGLASGLGRTTAAAGPRELIGPGVSGSGLQPVPESSLGAEDSRDVLELADALMDRNTAQGKDRGAAPDTDEDSKKKKTQ